ncbi:unnamed protein product [Cuscuta campestris]|uniref:Uncharacterized protein n=1 Tax=Cuscuta campestris TaxID=132261 RepID=A0A484LSJ3_9ASTE|nr:unnamed protein product [Cuscuta campestris]
MPKTYVVHLGNSKELMEVAEDSVAKRVLREHVRESLGVRNEDILFALINIENVSDPILPVHDLFPLPPHIFDFFVNNTT